MTSIFLIAMGSILILSGVFLSLNASDKPGKPDTSRLDSAVDTAIADGVITPNERDTIRRIATDTLVNPDVAIRNAEIKMASLNIKAETEIIDPAKLSGYEFEKFIVKKFNPKYFKIKNWAGDKYVEGRYAETTPQPDLLMEFSMNGKSNLFAVECKWRKNESYKSFEFATEAQLDRYKKFETKEGIPVFIVIGTGGEGGNPEHLLFCALQHPV
ncbi:MAG: hypothetical protein K0B15_16470 [Lentimicrobium sp.]|nr:hypothetical protein [Lentimicrobium sp.]